VGLLWHGTDTTHSDKWPIELVNSRNKAFGRGRLMVAATTPRRRINSAATATSAQYLRIAKMLKTGTKSTFDFRRNGIIHPSGRIKEMRERYGFNIQRIALRNLIDADGYEHVGIAIYRLISAPKRLNM